jgi:hypothetical protein
MNLSPETITILANFSQIHKSILFRPGSVLRTRTEAIFAEATVAEVFPIERGIVDLGNLLSALSLFKAPDLLFEEHVLRIVETFEGAQKAEVLYGYAGEDMVTLPMRKKAITISDEQLSFSLSEDELVKLRKAVNVFQKPEIRIVSDATEIQIGTYNHKLQEDQQGQCYTMAVESETNGIDCKQVFDFNNLKLLKGDYACQITKLFTKFQHRTLELSYLIGPEPSSTFGSSQEQTTVRTGGSGFVGMGL